MNVVCPYCHCLGLHKVISHLYGVVKLQCAECKGTFLFERKNDEKVSD
jgi:excinuclease UvrABC ATPase subunit